MAHYHINDQFSHKKENIRLICRVSHLTGFYIIEPLLFTGFRFTRWKYKWQNENLSIYEYGHLSAYSRTRSLNRKYSPEKISLLYL